MVANSSHNSMKGLQLFIADLRGSLHAEDREKRIMSEMVSIRKQFGANNNTGNINGHSSSTASLSGYQRKKYIAKLAYIFIVTNTTRISDVMFGLDQCCELMASVVYSEKFIAYMTLELLYNNPSVIQQIGDRVVQQLKIDLASTSDNMVSLALNFLGVTGKCDSNLTRELIHEVFQVLRSPTSAQILKKKSALAFLALLRNDSSILTQDARRKQLWIQRIMSLLDDTTNYRLMISVLPLIEYIAREVDGQACVKIIPQLSDILFNCISAGIKDDGTDHYDDSNYNNIPNPWIVTKVISILNILISSPSSSAGEITFSNIDQGTLGKLRTCVTKAIEIGTRPAVDVLMRTVQNTILFSLINFASKLDPSADAIVSSVNALCSLLTSSETNTRYLTLDCLIKLCSVSGKNARDEVRTHHMDQLFHLLLMERDTSIVRKVVDLLYALTDASNVQSIVNALLKYMTDSKQTHHHIRSDIAVKVAFLTENFATDSRWYVGVLLNLLSFSNASFNSNDIWQRLCQIVVNNESLHQLTCEYLLDYLAKPNISEAIVKAGAFLLGEYVELVITQTSCGELFNLFTEKYFSVSNLCRAMILTTMMKLYKRDSQIGSAVIKFFQLELNSLDVELQTRSYEYLKIIQLEKVSGARLMDVLFQPMVPFTGKRNPLLNRLGSAALSTSNLTSTLSNENSSSTAPTPPPTRKVKQSSQNVLYENQRLSTDWKDGFRRMLKHKQGVFYSTPFLKIFYRLSVSPSHPELLEVALTYVNISDWPITSLLTELISYKTDNDPSYIVNVINVPTTSISVGERATHKLEILTRRGSPIDQSPILNVNFKCGGNVSSVSLKITAAITSTIYSARSEEKSGVSLSQFVQRWRALGDALGKDGEFHRTAVIVAQDTLSHIKSSIDKMSFDIVEQTTVENTIFAAGIVHTKIGGSSGCLMKLRCLENEVDLTCKTTQGSYLAELIIQCVCEATI
ncbi:LANO_0E06722g1_1 [Lachancea nothofagi CBS 11611]|uniref:AP-2 complex subunit alpha n=1 Tax=Lachancea nothofagi CBS 11611 TaxID=1266666 RepID=A0A1G4JU23_9SACH|nr:LANO_0E06722g1_1 [Lachancea nothofagi CBS 11611]